MDFDHTIRVQTENTWRSSRITKSNIISNMAEKEDAYGYDATNISIIKVYISLTSSEL